MQEMRVYIANLGKYNEGKLVGEWFTPPLDFDEVNERIGLNSEYEECAIHAYECPVEMDEYMSIDEVNNMYYQLEEIEGSHVENVVNELLGNWFSDLEELVSSKDDIYQYHCDSFEELAEQFADEGLLGEIPDSLRNYIDFEALGRDLEINGNFLLTNHGIFEYTR